LAGALLVGVTYAKALAFAQGLPLIAVNHLEGHIHAVLLHERESAPPVTPNGTHPERAQWGADVQRQAFVAEVGTEGPAVVLPPDEPALALVVSGGHTHLFLCRPANDSWTYSLVGRTLDDAAGEAYDKVAKLLGFGYPGGPWIDNLARYGNPLAVPFAFSQIKPKVHLGGKPPRTKAARTAPIANLDPHFLFSFSGIKTAVLRYVELHNMRPAAQPPSSAIRPPTKPPQTRDEALALCPQAVLDLVASFQHAVVGDLMKKTFAAAESLDAKRILITGGVAANRELRARFTTEAARRRIRVAFPTPALSTDNAAMIAAAAWPRFQSGDFAPGDLSADASLALGG
jgi:N6-L-threonylcarbamoyladenine synthase